MNHGRRRTKSYFRTLPDRDPPSLDLLPLQDEGRGVSVEASQDREKLPWNPVSRFRE